MSRMSDVRKFAQLDWHIDFLWHSMAAGQARLDLSCVRRPWLLHCSGAWDHQQYWHFCTGRNSNVRCPCMFPKFLCDENLHSTSGPLWTYSLVSDVLRPWFLQYYEAWDHPHCLTFMSMAEVQDLVMVVHFLLLSGVRWSYVYHGNETFDYLHSVLTDLLILSLSDVWCPEAFGLSVLCGPAPCTSCLSGVLRSLVLWRL